MSFPIVRRASLGLALAVVLPAWATNGYLPHGYGTKSKGAAGVGAALPQDTLTIATNPAGLVDVDNRVDLGLEVFVPDRSASIRGNAFGADESFDGNGTEVFFIPEFGYSHSLSDTVAVGVAVFGHGGMNTDYDRNPYARWGSSGDSYMNLEQLFVAPAVAWTFAEGQSVGLALNLSYQRFELKGVSVFAPFSADPAHLTDNGSDDSTGVGVRLGWLGEFGRLTLGASWQSKTHMDEFDEYAGLFVGQGGFDVPENYVLGAAFRLTDATTVALDWQEIRYSDVDSVGNSITQLWMGNPLGSDNGPGFAWEDMRTVKLGIVHRVSRQLTLRAGYSHGDQPIPEDETFFNIIAPGVIEDHLTLGASWALDDCNELSIEYAHAFEEEVHGRNSIPPGFPPTGLGGGEADISLQEDSFGIAWSHSF